MYQNITIVGNLGSDVDMRYTPSGVPVAKFSVAVNKSWTDAASGEKKEQVTWFRINVWRKQAEVAAQYLKKGQRVLVTGEVEAHAYTNRAGEPAATLEVTANTIKFMSSKNESNGDGGATQDTQRPPESLTELEEIPF